MQMYVGITDYEWFEFLKERNANEVNFWKPGTQPFKALNENDLFLFKLHAPQNYIVGGGFFVKYSFIPTYLAWNAFGEKNGTKSLRELNEAISKYRIKNNIKESNPQIGCIILTDVFYFDKQDWIRHRRVSAEVLCKERDTIQKVKKEMDFIKWYKNDCSLKHM